MAEKHRLDSFLDPFLEVNDHPLCGWVEFSAISRKGKSTSVLSTVHLQPGAEHPVRMARN
ncbi:MAG: hypothetical protein JSU83_22480 [Deltaproteobacteria bacterium]|nr:MAG: hypothetical protein JSU83_22480 [Deltaproteobacteria bacterium]